MGTFAYNDRNGQVSYLLQVFEDKNDEFTIDQIIAFNKEFRPSEKFPSYGLTNSAFWFKIEVINNSLDSNLLLKVENPNLHTIDLYYKRNGQINLQSFSSTSPEQDRVFNTPYPLFKLIQPPHTSSTYYMKVKSKDVVSVPVSIERQDLIISDVGFNKIYFSLYAGIVLAMSLYNFFLYLSLRDNIYLYYVVYIVAVGFTQACLKGYAAYYIWPDNELFVIRANHIVTVMSGIFSAAFTIEFLRLKSTLPKLYLFLLANVTIYVISVLVYVFGYYKLGQEVLQYNTTVAALVVLFCSFYIYHKGYKPALFFGVAWSFFLGGVILYVLKDVGVLPFNTFTNNAILIGSALEATLLSFALADKINMYKKEKEESQTQTLLALKENERLIREQNIVLEQRVAERTKALRKSNQSLQETLTHLKEAQGQLVEAEKMASLGQLTAGVAHEINNPINFVTSNVAPLRRDIGMLWEALAAIEDIAFSTELTIEEKIQKINAYKEAQDLDYLKTEIDFLLKGMHEGAHRTAEIVRSLRIFSRTDGDSLKYADINEGLESTLVILNSLIREETRVVRQYGQLPEIACYPGKLNQVFLNIITNALYAIHKKFNGKPGGVLGIKTDVDADNVYISIKDNGIGMPADIRDRIFEPFFTTKEVGEGTGLGLSIVYNTIKKHQGEIKIESEVGEGTEFMLSIPLNLQAVD
ncbi:sensor histidine kinase [Parapedobacter composti]|nr:7TM diverse intracellular signaling domain-containing protein [Parapedobacter composti]